MRKRRKGGRAGGWGGRVKGREKGRGSLGENRGMRHTGNPFLGKEKL